MRFVPKAPQEGMNVSKQHPLKEALFLVASVSAVAVFILALVAFAADLAVPWVPMEWEARAFGRAWPSGFGGAGTGQDHATRQVQALIDRLAAHWPDPPYRFRTGVIREEIPNAFALPGGMILVTSGLLAKIDSENELAFVLGHELGHFRNRDHLRGLGRQLAVRLLLTIALGNAFGGNLEWLNLVRAFTERRFSRGQETNADRFALEVLYREFGHVGGATDFFEHLPKDDPVIGQRIAKYLTTHPLNEERIEALKMIAEERLWPADGPRQPFGDAK